MVQKDWELSEDFYKENSKALPSFEQFVAESYIDGDTIEKVELAVSNRDSKLEETVNHIKAIKEEINKGHNTEEIARNLKLDVEYVRLVQMTIQGGFTEDDDIAIAHLVLMG